MERGIILGFIALVVLCGLAAGGASVGFNVGQFFERNPNPQSAYVPQPGDCIVLPQGQDAVYDLFYAKEVNPLNCTSYKTQEEAQFIQAQARALDAETTRGNFTLVGMGFLALCIILFFLWAATR